MASVRWSVAFLICFIVFAILQAGEAQQGVLAKTDGPSPQGEAKMLREASPPSSEMAPEKASDDSRVGDAAGGGEAKPGGCGCKAGIRALEMKKIRELKQEEAGGSSG